MRLTKILDPRSQRGMSVLELMIAMAITSLVLSALAGVIFGAYDLTREWGQRVYDSGVEDGLPAALQADAHRYPACSATSDAYTLQLCLPATTAVVVTYTTTAGCDSSGACDLVRTTESSGASAVVARRLLQRPRFTVTCTSSAGATTGVISVAGIAFPPSLGGAPSAASQSPLVVYFAAPAGGCGG
ncbi:MAG TPA: prepilin-type N-terminal cleavage/methylation domain-containing protein [Candidatus Dormibacteraeota bacterium]